MRNIALAVLLLFALSAKSVVLGAKIITPQSQLREAATHIIVGKIVSVSEARHANGDYSTTTGLGAWRVTATVAALVGLVLMAGGPIEKLLVARYGDKKDEQDI